jgi:hypothetical protein
VVTFQSLSVDDYSDSNLTLTVPPPMVDNLDEGETVDVDSSSYEFRAKGPHVTVQFAAGAFDTAAANVSGFRASFTCQDMITDACSGGVSFEDSGEILHVGAGGVQNDLDCSWALSCSDPDYLPRLTFETVPLPADGNFVGGVTQGSPTVGASHSVKICEAIYNESSTAPRAPSSLSQFYELEERKGRMTVDASGDEIIGQLFDVGSRDSGVFEAWDSFATVRYVTDNQTQGTGFKASFSCYRRPQHDACDDPDGLDIWGTNDPLRIDTFSLTPMEHPLGRRNYAEIQTARGSSAAPLE